MKDVPPGCFLQEWQAKDLWLTQLVRVAGKGLTNRMFRKKQGAKVEMSKVKRERGLNAEALNSQEEEPGEGQSDGLVCDENMGQGSISLADK